MTRLPDAASTATVSTRRQTMPYFFNANYSQVIACLPSCVGDGAKHEPVVAGPHLAGKSAKSLGAPKS